MDYVTTRFVTSQLYLATIEDCVPLSEGVATGASDSWRPEAASWEGAFNLSSELKKQGDETYVLKADDAYEVCYTLKNVGTSDLSGYVELADSIYSASGEYDTEEYAAQGTVISLKPGESTELKLTIRNEDDKEMVHRVSFVSYDEYEQSIVYAATEPFVIRPVYDLSLTDITVTPIEDIDDEYADAVVNGSVTIEADKTYTKEVTIPAGGSIDYSELLDLQGLVQNKDYTVLVAFDINFMRKSASETVSLYNSDTYMINDATPTAITAVPSAVSQPSGIYDLQGRRVSGKHGKGIYIIDGKKVILK